MIKTISFDIYIQKVIKILIQIEKYSIYIKKFLITQIFQI